MDLALDLFIIFGLRLLDVGMSTVRIDLLGSDRRGPAAALELRRGPDLGARSLPGAERARRPGSHGGLSPRLRSRDVLLLDRGGVADAGPGADRRRRADPPRSGGAASPPTGYGATVVNGDGLSGEVRVTFCIVPRKELWSSPASSTRPIPRRTSEWSTPRPSTWPRGTETTCTSRHR